MFFYVKHSQGLSPRVRGNPSNPSGSGTTNGTIPAGAGEPTSPGSSAIRPRDYPRGCGGTQVLGVVRS